MPYAPEQDCEHGLSAALCAGPGHYPDDDRGYTPAASMSDAHREWHWNTGVPMGTPGCPQDACHPPDDYDDAAERADAAAGPQPDPWAGHIRPGATFRWDEDEPPF